MSSFALALILASALLHATWNYHLKQAASDRTFWLIEYSITVLVTLPVMLTVGWESIRAITPLGWGLIVLSAPIHVLYGIVLQIGYRKSDYSIVYPTARGSGPLITVLAAVLIVGNTPSAAGWCGIACIIGGIVLLAMRSGSPMDASRIRTGLLWGLITGCFIASYSFCDAWAVQQDTGLTPLTFYFPSVAMRVLLLAPVVLTSPGWKTEARRILTTPSVRRNLAVVAVGSPGAYLTILFALTMAPLAYVAPTREVGMMAGVLLGAVMLHEKLSARRLCGIALMVCGVIFIAMAK